MPAAMVQTELTDLLQAEAETSSGSVALLLHLILCNPAATPCSELEMVLLAIENLVQVRC
jgi:hypothetical protein